MKVHTEAPPVNPAGQASPVQHGPDRPRPGEFNCLFHQAVDHRVTDLIDSEFRLQLILESHARGRTWCWPSNDELEAKANKGRRAIQVNLAALERKGWIRRVLTETKPDRRVAIVLIRRLTHGPAAGPPGSDAWKLAMIQLREHREARDEVRAHQDAPGGRTEMRPVRAHQDAPELNDVVVETELNQTAPEGEEPPQRQRTNEPPAEAGTSAKADPPAEPPPSPPRPADLVAGLAEGKTPPGGDPAAEQRARFDAWKASQGRSRPPAADRPDPGPRPEPPPAPVPADPPPRPDPPAEGGEVRPRGGIGALTDEQLEALAAEDPILRGELERRRRSRASAADAAAAPRPPTAWEVDLVELLGNLEGRADLAEVAGSRLATTFGDEKSINGFRAVCLEAARGELPIAELLDAYRQATGPKAKNPGAILMTALAPHRPK